LLHTSLAIKEIAEVSGYNYVTVMGRHFVARHGVTPSCTPARPPGASNEHRREDAVLRRAQASRRRFRVRRKSRQHQGTLIVRSRHRLFTTRRMTTPITFRSGLRTRRAKERQRGLFLMLPPRVGDDARDWAGKTRTKTHAVQRTKN
jgi:hypothetical protein